MKKNYSKLFLTLSIVGLCSFSALAQAPVILEAEASSSTRGSAMVIVTEGDITFMRATADVVNSSSPGNASHVVSYTVVFPEAGTYHLYVKYRILSSAGGGSSDDSFYYGNGFGAMAVDNANSWILVNQNHDNGFTADTDVVTTGGATGTGVWKWLKLTGFTESGETGPPFVVPEGGLTQTFQFGSRENGLDIDKFAFGLSTQTYTVSALNTSTVTSIKRDEERFAGTQVYPNPVINGKLSVKGNRMISSLKVMDSTGREVKEFSNLGQGAEFNLNLAPSLYIIQLSDGEKTSSRRIIVN